LQKCFLNNEFELPFVKDYKTLNCKIKHVIQSIMGFFLWDSKNVVTIKMYIQWMKICAHKNENLYTQEWNLVFEWENILNMITKYGFEYVIWISYTKEHHNIPKIGFAYLWCRLV